MKRYPFINELPLKGKRVFVRVDFNVPIRDGEVSDARRIVAALPTIQFVRENGGRCILGSHLGRPQGKSDQKYSMEPIGRILTELVGIDIILADDCIGDGPRGLAHRMRHGDVLLLENLRFHEGEEKNSPDFVSKLAELCDVYVNDAFGTLHRAHASTVGLPHVVDLRGLGYLVRKELEYLEPLRDNPLRPFMLVIGGAKVSEKIMLIEHFLDKIDVLVIGGVMAYAFLKARAFEIGQSLCDDKQVRLAARILKSIEVRRIKLILPLDHVVAPAIHETNSVVVTPDANVPQGLAAFDVGSKTVAALREALESIETVFWNGPVGVFEQPVFSKGTFEFARAIAQSKAKKMAGGGDVSAAITQSGSEEGFDFISTGGGATLEYLEGKDLPGLRALELAKERSQE